MILKVFKAVVAIKLPESTLSNAKDFSALIFIPLLRGFDIG